MDSCGSHDICAAVSHFEINEVDLFWLTPKTVMECFQNLDVVNPLSGRMRVIANTRDGGRKTYTHGGGKVNGPTVVVRGRV